MSSHVPPDLGCQRRADRRWIGVDLPEDASGGPIPLLDQGEQDVLGIGLLATRRRRLPAGQLDHVLGATGEQQLLIIAHGAPAHHPQHRHLHLPVGHTRALEDARGQAFVIAQQREQEVLGADVAVLQLARLVAGTAQGLSAMLCEVLGQSDVSCLSMAASTDFRLAWRRS